MFFVLQPFHRFLRYIYVIHIYFQVLLDSVAIGSLRVDDKSIADMTALEVGNVGENIAVRRAVFFRAIGANQHLASYVHSTGKFTSAPINILSGMCSQLEFHRSSVLIYLCNYAVTHLLFAL